MKLDNRLLALVAAGLVLLVATQARSQRGGTRAVSLDYELPTHRIVLIKGTTLRVDTRTGATSILRGKGTADSTGDSWALRIPAVKGATSGMLDVQTTRKDTFDGVYLTDIAGDRTWLLKYRGNENGEWREVPNSP